MNNVGFPEDFDANGLGIKGKLFGLPCEPEGSALVIVPVPWEATVSYHTGTAQAPQAILEASLQVDLFQKDSGDFWKQGISMLPIADELIEESNKIRSLVSTYLENGQSENPLPDQINVACENLNIHIKTITKGLLQQNKRVGLVGGDHSTPLGFLKALNEKYERFGILHIDAHMDLRRAYQGFTFSHGSIMYNALKLPAISRIVQVGIRDYCEEEFNNVKRSVGRVAVFFDEDLKAAQFNGTTWDEICSRIIKELPEKVYISFDIDGLDPKLCPNTGTPVPGGLDYDQAVYLIKKVVTSKREIIGFDLSEVAPGKGNDWDGNVGARILFQLCNAMLSCWFLVVSYSSGLQVW